MPSSSTDFANPLILPGSSGPGSTSAAADPPPEDCVTTIVSMGFSRDQALKALRATVCTAPGDLEPMGRGECGGVGVRVHQHLWLVVPKTSTVWLKLAVLLVTDSYSVSVPA